MGIGLFRVAAAAWHPEEPYLKGTEYSRQKNRRNQLPGLYNFFLHIVSEYRQLIAIKMRPVELQPIHSLLFIHIIAISCNNFD
jgi:hypothetical protein